MNNDHLPTQCAPPPKCGNTYEITINENDILIVTVETRHPKIKPKTVISPRGIELNKTQGGEVYHKVDWSIKPADKEYYD